MKLSDYLQSRQIGATEFGATLGVGKSMISQICSGTTKVPWRRALQIERLTRGKVMRWDLCPDWAERWPELKKRKDAPKAEVEHV